MPDDVKVTAYLELMQAVVGITVKQEEKLPDLKAEGLQKINSEDPVKSTQREILRKFVELYKL